MTQALADGPIADLIVVLERDDEAPAGQVADVTAVRALAVWRAMASVKERLLQGGGTLLQGAEILVISGAFAGDERVERVVKVVTPLCVDAVAVGLARPDHCRVVQVALGNEHQMAAEDVFERVDLLGQLLEEVPRRGVDERVNGVEPQAVEVVVAEPHRRVVAEEPAHLVAAGVIEVHGVAPRRVVAIREVRPELANVVTGRPEVVVDDIENNGQAMRMTRIDQSLQVVGRSVAVVWREQVDAVVTPPPYARELTNRHQLHVRDAECGEIRQPANGALEGTFFAEGADV
jgi:hypothetical protein